MSDAPPALSVSGASPLGEARNPSLARAGNRRILGRWRFLGIALLLGLLAVYLGVIGVMIQYDAPWQASIPLAIGFFVLLFGLMLVARRIVTRVVVTGWRARGLPDTNTLSYTIDEDALVVAGAASTTRLRWAYVGELAPAGKGYWLLPAAGLFYYLPRRFFATPETEAAFINAMLTRMTPAARDRSAEARRLVAFE